MRRLIKCLLKYFKGPDSNNQIVVSDGYIFLVLLNHFVMAVRGVFLQILHFKYPKIIFVDTNVHINGYNHIQFGNAMIFSRGVLIYGYSENGLKFGNNVSFGPYSIVRATSSFSKIGHGLSVGNNCGFDAYCFLGASGPLKIGNDVICGQHVSFHPENHIYDRAALIRLQNTSNKGIIVGDNCWLGANVTVLDGAIIESGCIIGANSVVIGYIPKNSIAVGNPAKVVKST